MLPFSRLQVVCRYACRRASEKCVVTFARASTSTAVEERPKTVVAKGSTASTKNDDSPVDERFADFFDIPDNWGVEGDLRPKMRPGRPWNKDELRGKSNVDLHKLWYVLLKERNMLMTMKRIYARAYETMPNAERFENVEESMAAVECVVDERNRAYSLLEKGVTEERPTKRVTTMAGFVVDEPLDEHLVPPCPQDHRYETPELDDDVEMFQKLWAEEEWQRKQHERDDALSLEKKHRLKYRNEREVQVFHDYHPDNKDK